MTIIESYVVKVLPRQLITGYSVTLTGPAITNTATISDLKDRHLATLVASGRLLKLMALSRDHIGYAFSEGHGNTLTYFVGATVVTPGAKLETRQLSAGHYLIMTGKGGPSRQLFDTLKGRFFSHILPRSPQLYRDDRAIVEVLLNADPQDAEVELRIPVTLPSTNNHF